MSIPLVQNNEKDSINTSIIAIKRNIERINMLLGLNNNSEDIDTSEFVKKSEITDEVALDNMQSVTSNAVAEALQNASSEVSQAIQNERAVYYGTLTRGTVYVQGYQAGIICALRNGVGCGVFAFTTGGSGNGFATLNLLAGNNIGSYISRVNSYVSIDSGTITVLKW